MKKQRLWAHWARFTSMIGVAKVNGWHRVCNGTAIFQTRCAFQSFHVSHYCTPNIPVLQPSLLRDLAFQMPSKLRRELSQRLFTSPSLTFTPP